MHEAHEDMLQQNIASLQTQIHDLQAQLVAARADAKEVASQALQSASGRQVVEALQRAQEVQSVLNKTK
jgi:3-dehydroquinate dehydratase